MSREWTFKRSINPEIIDGINEAYAEGDRHWLCQYLKDPELFLAVCDNSINFYYRGNSMLKLSFNGNGLNGEVHYKYLLRPFLKTEGSNDKPYVSFNEKVELPSIDPKEKGAVKWIKAASSLYAGQEKEGVHKILQANENIVDVEIAFSKNDENNGANGSSRIDFCALRDNGSGVELCFYEAKHYSYTGVLRASNENEPKVVKQLKRYRKTIVIHRDKIHSAYKEAFGQMLQFEKEHPATKSLERARDEGFSVSEDVRLVVYGFDDAQKKWFENKHLDNLINHDISKDLILMKGASKGFKSGISK